MSDSVPAPDSISPKSIPYLAELGVTVETTEPGFCRLRVPFKESNSNPGGVLHGGVAASVIDIGGLAVAEAALDAGAAPLHTTAIQISYLSAAIGVPIVAEARMLKQGRELCFVETKVTLEDGKPVAAGVSTVRGRFGQAPVRPVPSAGDDGTAGPGPMGENLAKRVPFIGRLGMQVENMSGGRARIAMPYQEFMADGAGGIHEGPILALLDTTGAMAAWAETGPGAYKASTVGIQAQFVDEAPAGGDLIAYGRLMHHDREIFWCDIEVARRDDGRVIARGSEVYRIVIPEKG